MNKRILRQKGIALVPAMLTVAIVAAVATQLSLRQQVWLRQTRSIADRAQLDEMNDLAVRDVALNLSEHVFNEPVTGFMLRSATAEAPPSDVKGGTVKVAARDAQGLFNLNNLMRGGTPSPIDIGVFQRLLISVDLDPNLAEAVVDWIDPDSSRRPNGAEDADYLLSDNPHRAANRPMQAVAELGQVRGFNAEALKKLDGLLAALPQATEININTAPAPVLRALFSNLSFATAEQIVAAREAQPFTAKAQLLIRAGQPPVSDTVYGTASLYFLIDAESSLGGFTRKTEALVRRPPTYGAPDILWRNDAFGG